MFRPDPSLSHIAATTDQVVAVIESINQPQVSIPGHTSQAVQAHLVGVRNPNGTFSIYAGLYLTVGGANVIYAADRRELTVETYSEVEAEGLHFLESMGFMLDNTNFRNLAPALRQELLRRVPIFSRPASASAAADSRAAPRQSLGRFLAGF